MWAIFESVDKRLQDMTVEVWSRTSGRHDIDIILRQHLQVDAENVGVNPLMLLRRSQLPSRKAPPEWSGARSLSTGPAPRFTLAVGGQGFEHR